MKMVSGSKSPSLKVLVCGAGIAGPALAFWLVRAGHQVTVAERFPVLRAAGAQVDLRGQGIEAAKRMGLLDTIKTMLVDEAGVAFVNAKGRPRATIMANTSGQGPQSLTSEYEIMRGDLVRVLFDATKNDTDYRFDTSVDHFAENDERVIAHFADGTSEDFDLLVGADGQGSYVRRAILPPDADPYRRMGIHMAYWFIPRMPSDTNIRDTYNAPGGRMVMRRSHNATETQVYFVLREESEEASDVHRLSIGRQKAFWTDRFRDAGWQVDRFIDGMQSTDFFYSQEVVQVRTETWSKGRVVLLGDAAHCASSFSGMGISGSFVGAYVLAGEIIRNPSDIAQALANYDRILRPFVDEIQAAVKPSLLRLGMPKAGWQISAFHAVTALAVSLRIPDLISKISPEDRDGGWRLPSYPELFAAPLERVGT
jgi:2-polyprenyl-6-methoxyphenol hydroxylase-like FAD-dependent oxidoreductase